MNVALLTETLTNNYEKKYNCTPNYHKDKVIQVIISAKGILTITLDKLDKNLSLNSQIHQKLYVHFKLFAVLLIYKNLIPILW